MIYFIHYVTIALVILIPVLSVGIGQGIISMMALTAINQQPSARSDINRIIIFGAAFIETAAVIGLFIAFMLIAQIDASRVELPVELAKLGIALAICLPGLIMGIVSAFPAGAACAAVARQPFLAQKIGRFTLLSLALIQTPILFGFLIALGIQSQIDTIDTIRDSLRIIAAGLSIGIGCIGPAIGLSLFSKAACTALGVNRNAYNKIFSFTMMSQTIIETPIVFALIISLTLLFLVPGATSENLLEGITFLCAAIGTALGTVGPGMSSGLTASSACSQIALYPEESGALTGATIFAQGIIETSAIYAVLIGFAFIYFVAL